MARGRIKEREYVNTSLNLDKDLYSKLIKYMEDNKIPTKVKVVEDALRFYFSLVECERCGTLNHPLAKRCAVCNERLHEYKTTFEEVKSSFEQILQIIEDMHGNYDQCSNIVRMFRKNISRKEETESAINISLKEICEYLESQLRRFDELLFFLQKDNICNEDIELNEVVSEWEEVYGYDLKDSYDIKTSAEYEMLTILHETYLHIVGVYVDIPLSTLNSLKDGLKMVRNVVSYHSDTLTSLYRTSSVMQKRLIGEVDSTI